MRLLFVVPTLRLLCGISSVAKFVQVIAKKVLQRASQSFVLLRTIRLRAHSDDKAGRKVCLLTLPTMLQRQHFAFVGRSRQLLAVDAVLRPTMAALRRQRGQK